MDNKVNNIVIKNIFLGFGLEFNLLSVPVLERNGFTVVFKDRKGTILKNNRIVAVADRKHKLYELICFAEIGNASVCKVDEGTDL